MKLRFFSLLYTVLFGWSHCTVCTEGVQTPCLLTASWLVLLEEQSLSPLVYLFHSCTVLEFPQWWLKALWPKLTWGREGLLYLTVQGRNSRQEPGSRSWRRAMEKWYYNSHCGLLSLLSYNVQDHLPRRSTAHNELGSLRSTVNQKMPYRLPHRPVWWSIFSVEFLLPKRL